MRRIFLFDFSSPECWLAAERVNSALSEVPVWQPVRRPTPGPGHAADPRAPTAELAPSPDERAELDRRAAAQGLPPPRLPDPWPGDLDLPLRAAVFAQASGRVVAFSLAALRQAFAAGRDLSQVDNVLIAAAACELHPRAVLKGVESRGTAERLRAASAEAAAAGVAELPAIVSGAEVFVGPCAVEAAAARARR